jgi:hypothetical protein
MAVFCSEWMRNRRFGMHRYRHSLIAAGALWASSLVWAHNPVAECKLIAADTIQCKGGFSDGSNAPGVRLDLIGYDDKVIQPGKLGQDSMLTFKKPKTDFYILFDAGPGHVVEIDHVDIRPGTFKK